MYFLCHIIIIFTQYSRVCVCATKIRFLNILNRINNFLRYTPQYTGAYRKKRKKKLRKKILPRRIITQLKVTNHRLETNKSYNS